MQMGVAGLLFVGTFFFGFWLSRSGKPYPVVLFNLHKLIALGTLVFVGLTVYRAGPLTSRETLFGAAAGVCFVTTLISGGLLSVEQIMPRFVHVLHRVLPYLTVIFSAVTLFLLFG